jgi:two-component sensor histidine kinase
VSPEYALIDYVPFSRGLSPSEDRLLLDELTHRVSNELASLTETLGGSVDHRFGPQGTRSRLTFPLVEQLPTR